jgi:hypothetical protein
LEVSPRLFGAAPISVGSLDTLGYESSQLPLPKVAKRSTAVLSLGSC